MAIINTQDWVKTILNLVDLPIFNAETLKKIKRETFFKKETPKKLPVIL